MPAMHCTHQICKDVVVADAVLLQLYDLQNTMGRDSSIGFAIKATTAIIIATNTECLQCALSYPKYSNYNIITIQ